jgi:hypothetical protein
MKRLWRWLMAQVPSDEQMEARPENDAEIKRRMNELESLRAIARERVAQLHTTKAPIHRRSA